MPEPSPAPAQLKDMFDAARYRALAAALAGIEPKFHAKKFLKLTLEGLEGRELMARLHQTALAAHAALPFSYRRQVEILQELAPRIGHGFVGIFPCQFVMEFGQEEAPFSLEALRQLTRYGSAEFAIRPFLELDLAGTLRVMRRWTQNECEHVRRLASEGCRPRLPWGRRLPALVKDPAPLVPILHALKDDPALYVRKSVANNLNDISKDHPEWMLALLAEWDHARPGQRWIAKHACRTLIKKGHPQALGLFGFGAKPQLTASLQAAPARLRLGESLTLTAVLQSSAKTAQSLAVDYILHYARPGGAVSKKVFKWTEITLEPGATQTLVKRQTIRDFSTRRHHAGSHTVELQVNGHVVATTAFDLVK